MVGRLRRWFNDRWRMLQGWAIQANEWRWGRR